MLESAARAYLREILHGGHPEFYRVMREARVLKVSGVDQRLMVEEHSLQGNVLTRLSLTQSASETSSA